MMVKKQKGFTLIEATISIAIIGIICMVFLSMYTSAFNTISKSGSKSSALFNVQSNIEEKLNEENTTASTSITIKIDNSLQISIPGNIIIESTTVKGQTVAITAFKPQN